MLLRKPLPLWMSVSLFAIAVGMIPLIGQSRRRPISLPETLTELTVLLSQDAPELYVVPVIENKPEGGIYICTQPQPREQLQWLHRIPEVIGTSRTGRWEGVVFCEKINEFFEIESEDQELQIWGEHGMRIGPLLFFGDPTLLQRIRDMVSAPRNCRKKIGKNADASLTIKSFCLYYEMPRGSYHLQAMVLPSGAEGDPCCP